MQFASFAAKVPCIFPPQSVPATTQHALPPLSPELAPLIRSSRAAGQTPSCATFSPPGWRPHFFHSQQFIFGIKNLPPCHTGLSGVKRIPGVVIGTHRQGLYGGSPDPPCDNFLPGPANAFAPEALCRSDCLRRNIGPSESLRSWRLCRWASAPGGLQRAARCY